MKQIKIILAMVLIAASSAVLAAQLYRWVDEKGNVEWRDTPPPAGANVKKLEERRVGGGTAQTSELPFSVQQAMKNFPVTLWTTPCGPACDQAKAHLARRGVPYTEKDPQADVDAFQKLTGGNEVPVLYVGKTQIKGYLDSQYDSVLDAAGYPRTAPPGTGSKPAAAKGAAPKETPTAASAAPKPAAGATPPVRLYTHPQCVPCIEARNLLAGRGVGFVEVSASTPDGLAELEKVTGAKSVPALVIGQSVTSGFADTNYHKALDDAGFRRQ